MSAYVSIRRHTSAYAMGHLLVTLSYVSIRQHTSAYVGIRQHTLWTTSSSPFHMSVHFSIRQHTSAYVSIRYGPPPRRPCASIACPRSACPRQRRFRSQIQRPQTGKRRRQYLYFFTSNESKLSTSDASPMKLTPLTCVGLFCQLVMPPPCFAS